MRDAIARKLQAAGRRVDAIGRDGRGDPTDYDEYRLVLTGEERLWLMDDLEKGTQSK